VLVFDYFLNVRFVVDWFSRIESPSSSFYKFLLLDFYQQGYNL
jgi:hypothetical protein